MDDICSRFKCMEVLVDRNDAIMEDSHKSLEHNF